MVPAADLNARPQGDRAATFERLVRALGHTAVGREHGLARMHSFDDLRASLPVLSAGRHLETVETSLGFEDGEDLAGVAAERERVVERWRSAAGFSRAPEHFCVLGRASRAAIEAARASDLVAWGEGAAQTSTLHAAPAAQLLSKLRTSAPDVLVVHSLHSIAWLEREARSSIERAIPSLRCVLAHADLSLRLRSRLAVVNAGRWHPAGRIALPAPASDASVVGPGARAQLSLAWDSTLVELRDAGTAARSSTKNDEALCIEPGAGILGARYELVVSSPAGFLRVRTGRYVRLLGFDPLLDAQGPARVARVQPVPAPPADLALEGVTLRGAWLTAALRQAFEPEDPALVAAEVRGQSGGSAAPSGSGRARALSLRVEARGIAREGFEGRLAERFDRRLCRFSPAYAFLREGGELEAPRFERAKDGRERADLWSRASALQGGVARPQIIVVGGELARAPLR